MNLAKSASIISSEGRWMYILCPAAHYFILTVLFWVDLPSGFVSRMEGSALNQLYESIQRQCIHGNALITCHCLCHTQGIINRFLRRFDGCLEERRHQVVGYFGIGPNLTSSFRCPAPFFGAGNRNDIIPRSIAHRGACPCQTCQAAPGKALEIAV